MLVERDRELESSLRASLDDDDRCAVMDDLLDLLSRGLRSAVLVIKDTHNPGQILRRFFV